MMTFVQEYFDGMRSRLDFDLDFSHYLIKRYAKMDRENPDLAECFNLYLAKEGFDQAEGLSDDQHRKLVYENSYTYNAEDQLIQVNMCSDNSLVITLYLANNPVYIF